MNKLYLGLVQPATLFFLPASYAMVWLFGNTLLFVWTQHWIVAVLAVVSYAVLWKASDWDARFLDVLAVAAQHTPWTRNRRIHQGDSYAA